MGLHHLLPPRHPRGTGLRSRVLRDRGHFGGKGKLFAKKFFFTPVLFQNFLTVYGKRSMKNLAIHKFFVCCAVALCSPFVAQAESEPQPIRSSQHEFLMNMSDDMLCLTQSYPDIISGMEEEGDTFWITFNDGTRVVYSDDRQPIWDKDGVLLNPTVRQSMFAMYPQGTNEIDIAHDPGRMRSEDLFNALYGATDKELELAKFGEHKVRITTRHGMADAFARVMAGLEVLAVEPNLRPYLTPISGHFRRKIAGTERLSAHSYGIAIDLNPEHGAYWRWNRKATRQAFTYPQAIVEIFEANGFIWGGKWKHYDLMHFEYRPELLCKAKLHAERLAKQSTPY